MSISTSRLDQPLDRRSRDLRTLARLSARARRRRTRRPRLSSPRSLSGCTSDAHAAVRDVGSGEPDAHTVLLARRLPRLRDQAPRREAERRCARSTGRFRQRAASDQRARRPVQRDLDPAPRADRRRRPRPLRRPRTADLRHRDEPFHTTADGAAVVDHADPGEPVWIDGVGITCRRWNWRQTSRTAIHASTVRVGFIIDSLDADRPSRSRTRRRTARRPAARPTAAHHRHRDCSQRLVMMPSPCETSGLSQRPTTRSSTGP